MEDETLVGATIGKRYRLLRLLGRGGTGEVYKAADPVLSRTVAIKLLRSQAGHEERVDRFRVEARAAAAVGHPNIVDVLDFGYDGVRAYIVMEYLRGRTLHDVMRHEAPVDSARASHIVTHLLNGLGAAHRRGIVHRDIKPSNLILVTHLGDRDFTKICDFGLAALGGAGKAALDGAGRAKGVVGTPAYMAPEVLMHGATDDPRADLYSVAVILYELLAGTRPFTSRSLADYAERILHHSPPPPSRFARIPLALEQTVLQALDRDPSARFQSAQDLAEALSPFSGVLAVPDDDSSSTDSFAQDLIAIRARLTKTRKAMVDDRAGVSRDTVPVDWERPVDMSVYDSRADDAPTRRRRDTMPHPSRDASAEPRYVGEVSGAAVWSILRMVATRYGEPAAESVLTNLPKTARVGGPNATASVPYPAFLRLLELVDVSLGGQNLLLTVDCGRAIAELYADRVPELRKQTARLAEVFAGEIPRLTAENFRFATLRVKWVGRGYARILVDDAGPVSLYGCVLLLGFVERLLHLYGAMDAEVVLEACVALGDDSTTMDVSWLP